MLVQLAGSSIFSICNFHFNILYIVLYCICSFCFETLKAVSATFWCAIIYMYDLCRHYAWCLTERTELSLKLVSMHTD